MIGDDNISQNQKEVNICQRRSRMETDKPQADPEPKKYNGTAGIEMCVLVNIADILRLRKVWEYVRIYLACVDNISSIN